MVQVEQALQSLFPSGTKGVPEGEVIRQVFLFTRRKNPADNVGR